MSNSKGITDRCEALFSTLLSTSSNDGSRLEAAKLPDAEFLNQADQSAIQTIETAIANMQASSSRARTDVAEAALADDPDCVFESHWWGLDLILSESLSNKIAIGTASSGSLAVIIGAAFAGLGVIAGAIIGPLAGGFAAALALKSGEIKLVDNGNGVHFPISWPQMGLVVAGVSAGPAGIIAAIMAFIHPVAR